MKAPALGFFLALPLLQAGRMTYYSVSGRTAAEIRAAMNQVRPTDSHGLKVDARTTWDVKWTYRFAPSLSVCMVTRLDVSYTTAMTLPKWTNESGAPDALQDQWNAYFAALKLHEQGHIRIAELAVAAINRELPRVMADKCTEIGALIDKKGQEVLAEYKKKEVQYDAETNHGVKTGAKFP